MGLFGWYNKKVKTLNMWDIGAIKTYCLLLGIVIGAYIADFVKQYLWVFLVVIVLLIIPLMLKVFKK